MNDINIIIAFTALNACNKFFWKRRLKSAEHKAKEKRVYLKTGFKAKWPILKRTPIFPLNTVFRIFNNADNCCSQLLLNSVFIRYVCLCSKFLKNWKSTQSLDNFVLTCSTSLTFWKGRKQLFQGYKVHMVLY